MDTVWLFNGSGGRFVGGAFTTLEKAEKWINKHKLTGLLTKTPLDEGVFDWAVTNNMHNLKPELLNKKKSDPDFIGSFSTASQEHFHYENGIRSDCI